MARPRYTKVRDTRDSNHGEIVAFLQSHGIEVIETERPLDILIRRDDGVCGFAEIKVEGWRGYVQRSQIAFAADTRMPVAFVRNGGEALIFAESMEGLSQKQKDALGVFLAQQPKDKKQWTGTTILKVIDV